MADEKSEKSEKSSLFKWDAYDLKARLAPAMLVALPLILIIAFWWPAVWTLAGAGAGVLVAGCVSVLLALFAGSQGERMERRWGDLIGPAFSARLISHADGEIAAVRKKAVHAFLAEYGHAVPSKAEEQEADAEAEARKTRIDAVGWLVTITRPEAGKSLLLNENIAYGFWRNMRALKSMGVSLVIAVGAADGWLLYRAAPADVRVPTGIVLAFFCALALLAWIFVIRDDRVIDASRGYAQRLFALVDDPAVRANAAGKAK